MKCIGQHVTKSVCSVITDTYIGKKYVAVYNGFFFIKLENNITKCQ